MQALDLSSSVNNLYKSANFLGEKTHQKIEKLQKFAIRICFAVVSRCQILNSFFKKIARSLDDTQNFKVRRRISELLYG
jgi:uncharacterized protein YoxC